MESYKYMVRVSCMTYNHALYVVDTMNGFCIQDTSFPYVCTILDDASNDGEPEVIKQYLQKHFDLNNTHVVRNEETDDYCLTFAQHKTNKNCFFAVLFLKYNHYQIKKPKSPYLTEWNESSKYVALCEGDDYWIDPLKLQKQVDLMEVHPNCSLCHGDENFLKQETGEVITNYNKPLLYKYKESNGERVFDYLINFEIMIKTATTLFRTDTLSQITKQRAELKQPLFRMGDVPLWLDLISNGTVLYLDEVLAVYRISPGSASRAPNKKDRCLFSLSSLEMRLYYLKKYNKPIPDRLKEKYDTRIYNLALEKIDATPMYPLFSDKIRRRIELVKKYELLRFFAYWWMRIDTHFFH